MAFKYSLSLSLLFFSALSFESSAATNAPVRKFSPLSAARLIKANGDSRIRKAAPINRAEILRRLNSIVIPEMKALEGYTMSEVIDFLNTRILENDPSRLGVTLIINPFLGTNSGNNLVAGASTVPQIDPATGLPIVVASPQALPQPVIDPVTGLAVQTQNAPPVASAGTAIFNPDDIKIIGLKNKIRGLTAFQVIEMITQSFDSPIQYIIMDYGVVFFSKPASQAGNFSRVFRVNSSIFNQNQTNLSPKQSNNKSRP